MAMVLMVIYFAVTIPLFALAAVQSKTMEMVAGVVFVPLTILVISLSVVLRSKSLSKYEKEFIDNIVPKVLDESFESWNFEPKKGYTEADFLATGIEPHNPITTFHSGDRIEGNYRGNSFCQADLWIVCKTTIGTSKYKRETVIDGKMLRIHHDKYVDKPVFVSTTFGFDQFRMKYKRVETENKKFNSTYSASAENPEDVHELLTPSMMERMMELAGIDKHVMFVFHKEYLYVLRDGRKGIFRVFHKGTVEQDIERAYKDMQEIQKIMDCMKG